MPFIVRFDSELLIFIFRSEKRMGLLTRSDFAKADGIKPDLRIRWPKSSDLVPKSDYSTHWVVKSKNGIGLQSNNNLTEQSRLGTAAERGTHKKYEHRSMRWTMNECNHDARTQSPRLTAARLQLAVGRGLGPREQGEERTQRASFVATYHARVHTEQQLIVLGSDAFV